MLTTTLPPDRILRWKTGGYLDIPLDLLFVAMTPVTVLDVLTAMLLERKILLVSAFVSVLTTVGEGLKALIAPLTWPHVYAPYLPSSIVDCLQCPTPYIFGLQLSVFEALEDHIFDDLDVFVVHLDPNRTHDVPRVSSRGTTRITKKHDHHEKDHEDNTCVHHLGQNRRQNSNHTACLPRAIREPLLTQVMSLVAAPLVHCDAVVPPRALHSPNKGPEAWRFPQAALRQVFRTTWQTMM
jgi:hypothetical protein